MADLLERAVGLELDLLFGVLHDVGGFLLRLLPDKDDLVAWARGNRFVRGLTCTERLLFGVEAVDTTTFVVMSASMLGIGLLASYVPARRASLVDPIESLRGD